MMKEINFDEFKKLAEIALEAKYKASELSQRFWDADEGKVPCSDEEYAQLEYDFDNAERDAKDTYQDCLEYIDKIADELDYSAYKLNLPYEVREEMMSTFVKSLEKWLDHYLNG